MSARAFLDTNVLVYTFDESAGGKRARARELVESALRDKSAVISFQVVQEFLNVATRKFAQPMKDAEAALYLRRVLDPLCEVHSSPALYEEALDIRERWHFSFYDALIVAAALAAGCDTLYSEDLQDGQKVRELTVVNPFAAR